MVLFCFISIYFWFLYRWGRKPVLIVGIFLLIVPNFIRPWMPNLLLVAMCEFLNAMGSNITYVVPFTIGNCHKIYLIITFVDTLFSFCCLTPSFASLKPWRRVLFFYFLLSTKIWVYYMIWFDFILFWFLTPLLLHVPNYTASSFESKQ